MPAGPRCARQGLVARDGTCGDGRPRLGVLAGWYDGGGPTFGGPTFGGPAFGDGIVALSGVAGTLGGDAGDFLVRCDLVEKFGQHGGVTHVAAGDRDGPNRQCFRVDPERDLAPDTAFGTAMPARLPRAFALDLDPPSPVRSNRWRLPARCRSTGAAGAANRERLC